MTLLGTKRITKKTLLAYAASIGAVGVVLGTLLFSFMINTGVVTVGNYSSNEFCGGEVVCWLEMQNVCFNKTVFVYPMDGAQLINARPTDSINEFHLYRSWGKGLREYKLNETCKGSWCGGKNNYENKFSVAFREGKCYDLRIEVFKDWNSTINWEINPVGQWFGYTKIYDYKTVSKPIYKEELVVIKPVCYKENKSCSEEISYTKQTIVGYEKVLVPLKQIAIQIKEKQYFDAYVNKDGKVSDWNVPIGNRDLRVWDECSVDDLRTKVCEVVLI